ncbi:hypothetical protein Lal_00021946 [Lupinus albus]|nr:hypothetical protein Lal_00021946 [Lupinus albus]
MIVVSLNFMQVKWLRLLYNDFSAFSGDQEHLISFNERNDTNAADYVEGFLLMNKPPLDLSFYPEHDQPRITSLVTQYNIIYIIELVKYYDNNSQAQVEKCCNFGNLKVSYRQEIEVKKNLLNQPGGLDVVCGGQANEPG